MRIMSFIAPEWTVPELCVWIRSRRKDQLNSLSRTAQQSLTVANLTCPGAYAKRDDVIAAAQEGELIVTCSNPRQGVGEADRISLTPDFWRSAELQDHLGSWLSAPSRGTCAAFRLGETNPTQHFDLLVNSVAAKKLWPEMPADEGSAALPTPLNRLCLSETDISGDGQEPALADRIAAWLRTEEGSKYQRRHYDAIREAYKSVYKDCRWKISDETLRKVRVILGQPARTKGQYKTAQ